MIVRLFKPRFAPLVESGVKCQTVRPVPRRMPKAGEPISLRAWTGKPYRSKQRVLKESVVTLIRYTTIFPYGAVIGLNGRQLRRTEMIEFAKADGFEDEVDMMRWFDKEYGLGSFEGIVIYWE